MTGFRRTLVACSVAVALSLSVVAAPAAAAPARGGAAPGGPGSAAAYLGSNKAGFGTAADRRSHVWYTLQPGGGTGEIYYPDLGTPAARSLGFVVVDRAGHAVRVADSAAHHTTLVDGHSLTYRQDDTGPHGAWRLQSTYVTDPWRSSVLVDVQFRSLDRHPYRVYVLYEPTLSNTRSDDTGRSEGGALVAADPSSASALLSRPGFTRTSTGYRGVNDGWMDLADNGRMDWHFDAAGPGNLVQTGATSLTGLSHRQHLSLSLGFGSAASSALPTASASARQGFRAAARAYALGWREYLEDLKHPPASLRTAQQRQEYVVSEMVLAASEDKINRGAYVASPTMPWAWGAENPTGPYHLVWSRDLYQIATALIADGDQAGANRALDFLFQRQQKPDGSFPQNSTVAGVPFWTGLQLDEVADPIVLAYQLHRFDHATYTHVKAAADFLIGFTQDGNTAPWSPQERWENQSGYSPATIASEIAGLVCAAEIAQVNGDPASAQRYLYTADDWRAHLKGWTVTSTGPYSSKPYFLRLTKDGMPNTGTTYSIGDSGPSAADQRSVVDPSFLELVRLGILPARDRDVRNSVAVVDQQLSYLTARGRFWHRASFDGYGETVTGQPWILGAPADTFVTRGRGWPLLNGERGEYELAAGRIDAARSQLATMARTTNSGYLLPEQVWDNQPPSGQPGFTPGTPTLSATPLAWTHAQYIRLAQDVAAQAVVETPGVVAARYAHVPA
ncbi:MAG: glycoside hydrolase family 15 protein [Actinomycetota bacterium]|nr:glycoside hydrolase family 15 protein [Actinomycetota bacterium]